MMPQPQQSVLPRLWKGLFIVFVLASCLRAWLGPVAVVPRACAQIPDAGTQRVELIRTARESNRLLAEILSTLQKRTLNVRLASTDKNGDGAVRDSPETPRR